MISARSVLVRGDELAVEAQSPAHERRRRSFVAPGTINGLVAGLILVFASGVAPVWCASPPVGMAPNVGLDYGLATAKRANCMGCHKWHGDGGPGYGGAAISLRRTQLSRDEILTVIRCGRPGTNMPYFDKRAYDSMACYGFSHDDFSEASDTRPLIGKKFLNERQLNAVADFIVAELKDKPVTKDYCEKYFGGPTRQCEAFAFAK